MVILTLVALSALTWDPLISVRPLMMVPVVPGAVQLVQLGFAAGKLTRLYYTWPKPFADFLNHTVPMDGAATL